jgi:hypothetical protein
MGDNQLFQEIQGKTRRRRILGRFQLNRQASSTKNNHYVVHHIQPSSEYYKIITPNDTEIPIGKTIRYQSRYTDQLLKN